MVTSHTPLYRLTNITKLLQYNIDSLHDPEYLVAPKVLYIYLYSFKFSSLLKTKYVYKKGLFFVEKMKAGDLIKALTYRSLYNRHSL